MAIYRVLVEEIYSGYVDIEADSTEQAESIATEKTCSGEINPVESFDGNTYIEAFAEEK
jgi:hypothetical protein